MNQQAWDAIYKAFRATTEYLGPDFFGRIELNVFKGGIVSVNILQSYKPDPKGKGLTPEPPPPHDDSRGNRKDVPVRT